MADMIPEPEAFFRSLVPARDPLLLRLEEEAGREGIPIVGPVVGELLALLVLAKEARTILELGTATGYSTLYLARAAEAVNGRVVTLERDAGMAQRARANFESAGLGSRIDIRQGEAADLLAGMKEKADLIFLDIDKEHYLSVLPLCVKRLGVGGLLVADNTGFRLSEDFNRAVSREPRLRAVHLLCFLPQHSPERDAFCLAVRVP